MKKAKFSFGEGGFQGFAIRHVEKAVLGAVVALMALFVYQGYKLEGISASDPVQTPDKLREMVQNASTRISDASSWDKIKPTREVTMDVPKEVDQKFLRKTAPEPYRLLLAWDRPLFPKLSPRVDPKVFAPEGIRVVMMEAPIAALAAQDEIAPLDEVDSATGTIKKEPKKKKSTPAASPMGMAGMPPTPGQKAKKPRGSGSDPLLNPEASMPMPMGEMMGSGDMAGPSPTATGAEILGYRPTKDAIPKTIRAAVIMAVVPYEKQHEAFLEALSSAQGFDPVRDLPNYLSFIVQRADVTDDPAADPATLKWVRLKSPKALVEIATQNLDGFPEEVLEVDYLDDNLTTPVFPFMMRDLTDILTYPGIPRFSPTPVGSQSNIQARRRAAGGGDKEEEPVDEPGIGPADPMNNRNIQGAMPGSGQGGVRPRSTFKGHKGRTGSGASGMGGMPGSMNPMGSGAEMGMSSMPGYSGSAGAAELPPPKYKLVRFTDDTIKPNRIYRYRVKVYLEDPNRPQLPEMAPAIETLDEKVKDRIKAIDAAEEKTGQRKNYYVESEWSAASDPVSLPKRDWFYASTVSPLVMQSFDPGRLPPIPVKEPTAHLMLRVWDEGFAVDVPVHAADLMRGSPLTFLKTAKVIHPVTTEIKEIHDYKFRTDGVVADISGGETIPAAVKGNDKPKSAPGEVLVVDGSGRLVVQNEVDDIDDLKRFDIDESALAKQQPGGAGMPPPTSPTPTKGPKGTRQNNRGS